MNAKNSPKILFDISALENKRRFLGRKFKKIAALIFLILLMVGGYYGVNIAALKKEARSLMPNIYEGFKNSATALNDFNPTIAKNNFQSMEKEVSELRSKIAPGLLQLASLFSKKLPRALDTFDNFLESAIDLSNNLEFLKNNGFGLITDQQGPVVIGALEKIKNSLEKLAETSGNLKNQAAALGYAVSEDYLSTVIKLRKNLLVLESLINWLKLPVDQHLLILFQNPSEMRPAGGFIGSYAQLTLNRASLVNLDVGDIYWPDKNLDAKVIPPEPLQLITANWGARDANWFFDFPTSARKVVEFIEASKIYSEPMIKFSGVIAINVNVIEDILDITGPIELQEYELTLNSENFLAEIQKEVESGRDKKPGSNPKRILKILTPLLFEKISRLNEGQKQMMAEVFKTRLEKKDIMIYFKDLVLENYFQNLGVGGEVIKLPKNFAGDYLAVVNANIGGHKTDAFITQKIKLKSRIDSEGKIANELIIERAHQGENQKEWWYNKTNKNFIQVLTPQNSKLISISGGNLKNIKPPINYEKNNYQTDPDLMAVEESIKLREELKAQIMTQFGKTSFATWFDVPAGEDKELRLNYELPRVMRVANGEHYQFIFEKQSGVQGGLEFSIEAPPGYKWKQNNNQIFSYSTDDTPARLVLDLDLTEVK